MVIYINAAPKVMTGIEVLRADGFRLLAGKRVGLITNPTGVDSHLQSTIDILYHAPNIKLVALFGPEHGVRGDVYAGAKVSTTEDPETGIPVYSLYGKTKKPTTEMLRNIDVLVYDIQDIGCRSYTFVSTLGLAMEAAAENHIPFVVLDRPDPLGGLKIEGNLPEKPFMSFVSQFDIPYVYGLTCGELAKLLNGEHLIGKSCQLTVVKMKGWHRKMTFEQTGLPWVPSSPHIPEAITPAFYAASGILGELSAVSIGVGYTLPFQLFAHDSINAEQFARNMNALHLPGVLFRPIDFQPFYSIGKGQHYAGVQLYFTDYAKAHLTEIQFYVMQVLSKMSSHIQFFDQATSSRFRMFDDVCGSDQIRLLMSQRMDAADVIPYWRKDENAFRKIAKKYYLYH
ncbi:exo-beta-N-acetylmuramidase NamZ family protein [Microbacter margulisiae]|nr:DUF1343 domain-containing protein [Microbacter margulisiae]